MRRMLATAVSVILVFSLFTGCGTEKVAKTADEFKAIAEEKGYVVNDDTGTADPAVMEKILVATKDDAYQVEFYDFTSADEAKELFDYIANALDGQYSVKTLTKKVSVSDYNYYGFESGNVFMVVIRVDDTVFYSGVAKEYKEAVNEIIEIMGY